MTVNDAPKLKEGGEEAPPVDWHKDLRQSAADSVNNDQRVPVSEPRTVDFAVPIDSNPRIAALFGGPPVYTDATSGDRPERISFNAVSDRRQAITVGGDLGSDSHIKKLAEQLKNPDTRQPVDYKALIPKGTRFIGMGETHVTMSDRDEFIRSLPGMKKAGVTHVGIEGLRHDDDTAKLLGDYTCARESQPKSKATGELRKKIGESLEHMQHGTPQERKETLEKHLKMIDAAIDTGLKVFGIEPKKSDDLHPKDVLPILSEKLTAKQKAAFDQFFKEDSTVEQRADARRELLAHLQSPEDMEKLETARKLGIDLSGLPLGIKEDKTPDSQYMREFHLPAMKPFKELRERGMAAAIEEVITGGGTVLAFAGKAHFGHGKEGIKSVSERLQGYGTMVIGFAGGDYPKMIDMEKRLYGDFPPRHSMSKDATLAARLAGMASRYFAFRVGGSDREADVIIHVPERP